MGPYMVYFSLVHWVYPLESLFGETGCYLMNIIRPIYLYQVQLQSFFISVFRFVCLFHANCLQNINMSPNVRWKLIIYRNAGAYEDMSSLIPWNWYCFYFQTFARLLISLNFLVPLLSFTSIFKTDRGSSKRQNILAQPKHFSSSF